MKKDEIVGYIYETENFEQFVHSDFNRKVEVSTAQLENFEQFGVIAPIIVNEDMVVIDGQHRLAASRTLNIPIQYIVRPGSDAVQIVAVNSVSKNWKLRDYIEAYAKDGFKEYQKLLSFLDSCSVNEMSLIQICVNQPNNRVGLNEAVKAGKFKFFDNTIPYEYVSKLEKFIKETGAKYTSPLTLNLFYLYYFEKFDFGRFTDKVNETQRREIFNPKMYRQPLTQEILEIYNHKLSSGSPNLMEYHIDSKGNLVIDEKEKPWARKKTVGV